MTTTFDDNYWNLISDRNYLKNKIIENNKMINRLKTAVNDLSIYNHRLELRIKNIDLYKSSFESVCKGENANGITENCDKLKAFVFWDAVFPISSGNYSMINEIQKKISLLEQKKQNLIDQLNNIQSYINLYV